MGRKKKQKDIEDVIEETKAPSNGHNSELTDDEKRALMLQHKRHYSEALAAKKAADAGFKNICKKAKAECGKDAVADIKDAILFESDAGQAEFTAELERKHKVARWMNLPVGLSPRFFDDFDGRPAVDLAFDRGKSAGMEGADMRPPHDPSVPQYQRWLEGWHACQEILMSAFKKLEPLDVPSEVQAADVSDPPFVAPAEPAHA